MEDSNKTKTLTQQIKELEILAKISRLKFEIVEYDYKRLLYLKMLNNEPKAKTNDSSEKTKDN